MVLRSVSEMSRSYRISRPAGWGRDGLLLAHYVPVFDRSYVEGMYGGRWTWRHRYQGRYQAVCTEGGRTSVIHKPPEPDCGCGYWAYWNPSYNDEFGYQRPWVRYSKYQGYDISIPLCGAIEGSGATIIGEKGFRTERARITDLSMPLDRRTLFESEETSESSYATETYYTWGSPALAVPYNFAPKLQEDVEPVVPYLSKRLEVPEHLVRETIFETVAGHLGREFKWHCSPAALLANVPPDENYGK